MDKKVKYYVLIIKSSKGIDKLYRKDEKKIRSLKIMYENLYPKAEISITEEWV